MKNVYLVSVGSRSGKSVLSLGLALNYPGKAGFYKPFRESLITIDGQPMDQDAVLMAKVLNLADGERLSPFVYDIFEPISMKDVVKGYNDICHDRDFMVIEGSRDFANGCSHDISHFDIAKELNAPIILVSSTSHQSIDSIFMFKEICEQKGLDMKGVVLNRCEGSKEKEFLLNRDINVIGEIPNIPELRTFHVFEITENIRSEVIAGISGMDNVVEEVIVGAMSPQVAIRYMRRSKAKAVITGGDRTEIQLAALSTNTSCLIVTGGIMPSRMVTSRADELGVPIIMTEEDTLSAAELVEHLIARIDPRDTEKIDLIVKNVRKGIDLDKIW